ncbi:sporulation protein YhbH [Caldinitratiruptor microaerophilus]|uniref:Sporulation protein YhbH n=1 Tax=Caldinitratiruptor microaerophilus TaxID=671077 RepID=A0AA35CKN9_9FIRM|nr:sporulation protein YhbH [Caldinitratiruptor microaerophilus]BDG61050.1 sporulation protein YhbH [Caldinitratiruptor microaerophilus]
MFTPYRGDWSLHRKGPADQARHMEKIREAIKKNLPEIIAEENIITSDGKRLVKVPIRSLEEYRFRFDPYQGEKVGQGPGDTKVGDVIARRPGQGQGPGQGRQAGDRPGIDYYEAEITIDELAELIFEDLGLPNLRPKAEQEIPDEAHRFTDIRRKGPFASLDKRRSILESMKRVAREEGEAQFRGLNQDDLRFRVWEQEMRRQSAAVVIAMRDASGSMGEFKKYLTRSLFFWMVRFLRTKYQDVEIAFIVHHAEAREVDEETFFRLGESGGTRVSSAYSLCWQIIQERYDPARWNIYPFHFSDGDNWSDADNRLSVDLVKQILQVANLFGYGEVREPGPSSSLMQAFRQIDDPRFVAVVITDKKDVYPALQKWFSRGEQFGKV